MQRGIPGLTLLALACGSPSKPTLHVSIRPGARATWRETAWDDPDSVRAALVRGECWPFIEDSTIWTPCVARADPSCS